MSKEATAILTAHDPKNTNINGVNELIDNVSPLECSETIVTLMRLATQTEDFATFNEEYKNYLWFVANQIRAAMFDLKPQE